MAARIAVIKIEDHVSEEFSWHARLVRVTSKS